MTKKATSKIVYFLLILSLTPPYFLIGSKTESDKKENKIINDDSSLVLNSGKPTGKWFPVSDVVIADSLLKVDSAKNIFENKIKKEILFFPQEHQNKMFVNCPNNGLIQTIQQCYDNHRPLVLTPDVIWLAICQGVSIHINQKYDSLKNVIFIKDKPNKIIVRNDSLENNARQWGKLISSFSEETKRCTKDDFYSFFVPEFSTTTEIITTAYQVTLLESYKKAFDYVGESGCGIPSITITGSKKDWQTILVKLDKLKYLGLSKWAENLKPIISEFINTIDGKVNKEFWQSIYKNASEYGAFYISGWIIKFFPYIKEQESTGEFDEKLSATKVVEVFKPNEFLDGNRYLISTLSTDNFPSGIAKINVQWINYFKNTTKEIEIYAGFFAIKQYSDKTLEPLISWVVCDSTAKIPDHELAKNYDIKMEHKPDYWSPHICYKPIDSAVYDIKRFKTYLKSIVYLKALLLDSISKAPRFKDLDLTKDTLEFVVFTNGTLGEFALKGKNSSNMALLEYLKNRLLELPEKWFPALAHPQDFLLMMGIYPEEDKKLKVRVNSLIKITLFKS